MSDDHPKRPPRFPRPEEPDEPEVVRVDEDAPPSTDRAPVPLPPPKKLPDRAPTRLDLLRGRQPSYVEIAASLSAMRQTLEASSIAQANILSTQRKMALQVDGLGSIVNQRFDVFHAELSLLRATVTGDHAPRLRAVEKLSAGKRARLAAVVGGKWAGAFFLVGLVARGVGKALPEYDRLITSILEAFGL